VRGIPFAALLLCAATAAADTLTDIRLAVSPLHATVPASATVEVQRFRKAEGRFANQQSNASITVTVVSDATGLQLNFSPELLDGAAREAVERQADPKKPTPLRSAISDFDATSIAESLDFRPALLRLLAIARMQTESRVMWHGGPARLVVMKLTPRLPKEATSIWNVRFSEEKLSLWIGADNIPLAAERLQKGSAGFLFLRGEMSGRESWTFARVTDRLVVTRYESSFHGSGFGQRGEGKTVQIVTMK